MYPKKTSSTIVRFFAIVLSIAMVYAPIMGTMAWAKSVDGWNSMLRPGVMVGDSDHETDYFIDFLLPIWQEDKRLIYINPHLRVDDDNQDEENIGIGYRGLYNNDTVIYGGNIFFDSMDSGNGNRFNQIGLGFEYLSHRVDARVNGYIVIGDDMKPVPDLDLYSFGTNSLLVNLGMEEALSGVDAEVGVLVPGISDIFETRAFIGGFYYDSALKGDVFGWKARAELRPMKMLNLMVEYRESRLHDDTDDIFFVGGYLEFPLGKDTFKEWLRPATGARSLEQRMTEKVVRDRHIRTLIDREEAPTTVAAALFVNEDNETMDVAVSSKAEPVGAGSPGVVNGTGSLQDPYWHTDYITGSPYYQEGALVYVFGYDDTADTYLNASVRLLDDMTLWGEGYYDPIKDIGVGPHPILDGNAGSNDCVILGNNNEVMGLEIQNCSHGIYGQDIMATNIHDNIIHDNQAANSGIHIENMFNYDSLSGGLFNYQFANNEIYNNDTGISLVTNIIANTTISDTVINTAFTNNTIYDNSGYGIWMENVIMATNSVARSDVATSVTGSSINNDFTDNTVTNNGRSGIYIPINGIFAVSDTTGIAVDGSIIASVSGSNINNNFDNNVSSGNDGYGIYLGGMVQNGFGECVTGNSIKACASTEGGTITGNVESSVTTSNVTNVYTSNITNGNSSDGIYEYNEVSAESTVVLAPFTVNGNVTSLVADSGVSSTFDNNTANSNDGCSSCHITGGINSETYVTAWSSVGSSSTVDGDLTASVDNASIEHSFTNNQANDNTGPGISVDSEINAHAEVYEAVATIGGDVTASTTNSDITGTYSGNTANNNFFGEEPMMTGIHVDAMTGATATAWGSTVNGGMSANLDNNAIDLGFDSNTTNSNEGDGIFVYSEIVANAWAENSFINGPMAAVNNNASIDQTFTGNTADANTDSGIVGIAYILAESQATNNSTVNGDITASIDPSSITQEFSGNQTNTNDSDGIWIDTWFFSNARADTSDVNGSISADIREGTIDTTFADNTASGNFNNGINVIYAEMDVTAAADNSSIINGSISGGIYSSLVRNEFTGNTASGNSSNNINVGEEDNELNVIVRATNSSMVQGSLSGEIVDSDIENVFADNTINDSRNGNGVSIDTDVSVNVFAQTSFVNGSITASIDPTGVLNQFDGNTASGNYYDNVEVDTQYASRAYAQSGAVVNGPISATIEDGTIDNLFAGNTFNNSRNGAGVDVEYSDFAVEAYANSSDVNGGISGGIYRTVSTNDFSDNDISGNYNENVYAGNNDLAVEVYANNNSNVNGSLSGEIVDSGIENIFADNTINSSRDDEGVYIDNNVDVSVRASNAFVNGSITASVDPTGVLNQFDRNTISGNYGDNVYLDTEYASRAYAQSGAVVNGPISATIEDGTIDNLFAGNTINSSRDGRGVYIEYSAFDVEAYADLSDVNGGITGGIYRTVSTNDFSDNDISGNNNENVYVDDNSLGVVVYVSSSSFVNGSLSGEIVDSGIDNIFADNTINNNLYNEGVDIDNEFYVDVYANSGAFVNGSITASVDSSRILNQFDRNTISGNTRDNVEIDNEWDVYATARNTALVNGTISASILDSTIDNLFEDNTIRFSRNGRNGDGVEIQDNEFDAYASAYNVGLVNGSVTAAIDNSALTTKFTNNDMSGNDNYGVQIMTNRERALVEIDSTTVDGDVEASVTDSTVDNLFTDNTIDYNGYGGVVIGERPFDGIYARINIDGSGSGSTITGAVTATVDPVSITNRFVDNSISGNFGEDTGVDLDSYIRARIGVMDSTTVDGPVAALVDYATIDNIFTGNTIDFNSGDGVDLDNTIRARLIVEGSSTINNSVSATAMNVAVNNDLQQNSIDYNSSWGVDSDTIVKARVDVSSSSMIDGTATASLTNATVLNNFEQNSITDNGSGGVSIGGESGVGAPIGADLTVSSSSTITNAATAEVVNVTVDNIFTNNTIDGNSGPFTGVAIDTDVAANLNASFSSLYNGAAAVASNVDVSNEFTGNSISRNEGDGVDATSYIGSYTFVFETDVEGSVLGTTRDVSVTNKFTNNFIDDNDGYGINLGSLEENDSSVIYSVVEVLYSSVTNAVSATTANAVIDSDFSGNSIDRNDDGGVTQHNEIYSEAYAYETTFIGNGVSSEVAQASIDNNYTGNSIDDNGYGGGEPGDGVRLDNAIISETYVYNESFDLTLVGDASATTTSSTIDNTFASNTIDDNLGSGVSMSENLIGSETYVYSWTAGTTDVDGNVTSETSNSSIDNTFTGNSIDGNDAEDGYGVYIGSEHGEMIPGNAIFAVTEVEGYVNVANSVTATIDPVSITNNFDTNSIDDNAADGVRTESFILAAAFVQGDAYVAEEVASSVEDATVDNKFNANTLDFNGNDGADANTLIGAFTLIGDTMDTVDGKVSSSVTNATANTTFTGNSVRESGNEGLESDSTISAITMVTASTINNSVSATVTDSNVTATVSGNTIDNVGGTGVKLGIGDSLFDIAMDNPDSDDASANIGAGVLLFGAEINGDVTTEVTGSDVSYDLSGNTITDSGGTGVVLAAGEVDLGMAADANTRARTIVFGGFIDGDVTTRVTDSDVNYDLSGNTITGSGGAGVEESAGLSADTLAVFTTIIGNVTSSVDPSGIYTGHTNNTITDNAGGGIGANRVVLAFTDVNSSLIIGDVTATVDQTTIANIYNGNTITGNQGNAVDELNVNSARVHVFDSGPIRSGNGIVGSTISNSVDASISSTFMDNTMTDNNGGIDTTNLLRATTWFSDSTSGGSVVSNLDSGAITLSYTDNTILTSTPGTVGVEETNILGATTCVDRTGFPVPCLAPIVDPLAPGVRGVGGAVTSNTTDSSITSTFTSNIVNGVDTTNLLTSLTALNQIAMNGDNVVASVNNSNIAHTYTDNIVNAVDASSGISEFNMLGSATILNRTFIVYNPEGPVFGGDPGDVITETVGSGISTTAEDNTIFGNSGDGFETTNILGAISMVNNGSIANSVAVKVDDSAITTLFTNNVISNSAGDGIDVMNLMGGFAGIDSALIGNSVTVSVDPPTITNTFVDNVTNDNGGDGISVENVMGAVAVNFGSINNALAADVIGGAISSAFTNNTSNDNAESGFATSSTIGAVAIPAGPAVTNSVSDSSISESFQDNTATGNRGVTTGISHQSAIYPDDAGTTNSTSELFMEGNTVTSNIGNGVSILYDGPTATFTGDLGGGPLGSQGQNSLYGNNVDLLNNSGGIVNATNNWWGQDTGPAAGQIMNVPSATTDASGWLTVAP